MPGPIDRNPLPPPGSLSEPDYVYVMPESLYDADNTIVSVDQSATWFIPALVTGVPGLLVILLVVGHIVIGLSWLPGVGRLLGPTPEDVDDDRQLWWAAGRPVN